MALLIVCNVLAVKKDILGKDEQFSLKNKKINSGDKRIIFHGLILILIKNYFYEMGH